MLLSPDGAQLASGSYDRTVRVWADDDGRLLRTLTGHTDTVYSVAAKRIHSRIEEELKLEVAESTVRRHIRPAEHLLYLDRLERLRGWCFERRGG